MYKPLGSVTNNEEKNKPSGLELQTPMHGRPIPCPSCLYYHPKLWPWLPKLIRVGFLLLLLFSSSFQSVLPNLTVCCLVFVYRPHLATSFLTKYLIPVIPLGCPVSSRCECPWRPPVSNDPASLRSPWPSLFSKQHQSFASCHPIATSNLATASAVYHSLLSFVHIFFSSFYSALSFSLPLLLNISGDLVSQRPRSRLLASRPIVSHCFIYDLYIFGSAQLFWSLLAFWDASHFPLDLHLFPHLEGDRHLRIG